MGLIQPRPMRHLPGAPINGNSVVLTQLGSPGAVYAPSISQGAAYDATFVGTDSDEQGADFAAFVQSHRGQNLQVTGVVRVQGNRSTPAVLFDSMPAGATTTITFSDGAKIRCMGVSYGILNFRHAFDMVWNDLEIQGSGYTWVGEEDPDGVEDGLGIYGGGRLTFNRPYVHDNRGDALYLGEWSSNYPVDVVVAGPFVFQRNARNGIGHCAGKLTITGSGSIIDQSGLHNLDWEPNNLGMGASIDFVGTGIRLTNSDDIPVVAGTGYAASGSFGGGAAATKIRVSLTNCSADFFQFILTNCATTVFTGNNSDALVDGGGAGSTGQTGAYEFVNCGSKTVSGNTNIQAPSPNT